MIVTGKGLVIIDCDYKPDKKINGLENLEKYLKENNIAWPETLSVTTGGGGKHFYFKTDKCITNKVDFQDLSGIDVRGDGGGVIAPPSTHNSGNKYVWDNDFDIAPLPKEIEYLLFNYYNESNGTKKESTKTNKGEKSSTSKKKIEEKPYKELKKIPEGSRNDTLFRLACKVINCGVSKESLMALVKSENEIKCEPPLSEEEITILVNGVYKNYQQDIKEITSLSKIFSGKYSPASIAIYWCIWSMSLYLGKDTVYLSQAQIGDFVGLSSTDAVRENLAPLLEDGLIHRGERAIKYDGTLGCYSYTIL